MSSALSQDEEHRDQPVQYEWADDQPSLKVLWGRVLALVALLVGVYFLGRATAPPANLTDVERLQSRLAASGERIASLEERVSAAQAADDLGAVASAPGESVAQQTLGEAKQAGAPATKPTGKDEGETATKKGEQRAKGGRADQSKSGDSKTKPQAGPPAKIYTVRSGDSLNSIAGRYYGNPSFVGLIKKANHIRNAGHIQIGDKLELPPKP